MAPPRSSRLPDLPSPSAAINSSIPTSRHISAKEKDILHKPHDRSNAISKPPRGKPLPIPSSTKNHLSSSLPTDPRSTPAPNQTSTLVKQARWIDGPGSSEHRMHWSRMSNTQLNRWRNYLCVPISAPFSTVQAQLSLENKDGLGQRTPSMRGADAARMKESFSTSTRRPVARARVEREIAHTWEDQTLDEDEVIATFVARCNEDRELAATKAAGRIVSDSAGVFDRRSEKDEVERYGGGGQVNGTGGTRNRAVRCRSDMLAEW